MLFTYSFSHDNHDCDFTSSATFESQEEALNVARKEYAKLEASEKDLYSKIKVGMVYKPTHEYFFPDADLILEHIACAADDIAGEYSDDYLYCSKEAQEDLEKRLHTMLLQWIEDHSIEEPTFYQVSDISEHDLIK